MLALVRSPLVRRMLELVLAEPILLTAEERYLHGHYLAYLLSGSRRRGLFLRRPLEPRNADRARLLLGVTYAIMADATDEAIGEAAALLDQRIEVRTFLSPIVMAKYLSCRESPARRKLFRQTRKAIGDQSAYAQKKMLDQQGVLNPGLMPQKLADLNLLAPARTEVDDILVERWNRVAEVWRDQPDFRTAVLRYATAKAHRDPASTGLWPEVVYPLIERARWHRRIRGRTEAIWDYLSGKILHVADAGVVLDRAIDRVVPAPLVAELDESLKLLDENPRLDDEEADPFAAAADEADRLTATLSSSRVSLVELAAEPAESEKAKNLVRLADPDPFRFVQSQLHDLWKEALQALQSQGQARPGAKPAGHRPVPIGPYRLIVIPSIRGRAAGQIAIQGMANKQIELTTPTVRTRGSASKALLAIWLYRDNSLAIAHLDFMNSEHYVLWHAPKSHQLNFDEPGRLQPRALLPRHGSPRSDRQSPLSLVQAPPGLNRCRKRPARLNPYHHPAKPRLAKTQGPTNRRYHLGRGWLLTESLVRFSLPRLPDFSSSAGLAGTVLALRFSKNPMLARICVTDRCGIAAGSSRPVEWKPGGQRTLTSSVEGKTSRLPCRSTWVRSGSR